MIKRAFLFQAILLILFTFVASLRSQEQKIIRLELSGGSILVGFILSEDSTRIDFQTVSNLQVSVNKEIIIEREILQAMVVEGELWKSDPNQTRLFFSPTGRALKRGQGYFSVYEIFFPFLAVGITDWLAISGGLSLVPGAESQLLYLAPQITPVQREKYAFSGGILYIKIPNETDAAGIFYGVGTYGNESASITLGMGFAFGGGGGGWRRDGGFTS